MALEASYSLYKLTGGSFGVGCDTISNKLKLLGKLVVQHDIPPLLGGRSSVQTSPLHVYFTQFIKPMYTPKNECYTWRKVLVHNIYCEPKSYKFKLLRKLVVQHKPKFIIFEGIHNLKIYNGFIITSKLFEPKSYKLKLLWKFIVQHKPKFITFEGIHNLKIHNGSIITSKSFKGTWKIHFIWPQGCKGIQDQDETSTLTKV